MKTLTTDLMNGIFTAPPMNYLGAPRVAFSPNADGTPTADETAAANAAAAAEAEAKARAEAEAAAKKAKDDPANVELQKLAGEKADLLKEVMDKKGKLKDATDRLNAYNGVDPEKVKQLLAKEAEAEAAAKKAEQDAAEKAGEFDRVKQMMSEQHTAETKSLKDRIAELEQQNSASAVVIDNLTIGSDFSGSSFIKDNLTLSPSKARALYGSHFELKEGKVVAYDKPAGKAGRTLLVDAKGDAVGFEEAMKRIIEADPDKDTMLRAKITPGSASRTTETSSKTKEDKAPKDQLFGRARILAGLNAGS